MTIHSTAIVEDGALLGAGVEVGPYCLVQAGAELGDGVRLQAHVVIGGGASIGARTEIYAHAVLGGDAQIRGARSSTSRLVIGEDCVIREHVTMSTGSDMGHGITRVGRAGYFMAYSHIAHDCTVGDGVTFANGVQLGGHVEVGEGANFGGLSAVQQFGRVGRFAFVGGVTGVNEDVIPYGMVIGSRARLTGLNLIGLKRRNIARSHIHALRGAIRAIFHDESGTLASRAQTAAQRWSEIAEVQEVVQFILADAKRPVCSARRRTGVESE